MSSHQSDLLHLADSCRRQSNVLWHSSCKEDVHFTAVLLLRRCVCKLHSCTDVSCLPVLNSCNKLTDALALAYSARIQLRAYFDFQQLVTPFSQPCHCLPCLPCIREITTGAW